MAKMCEGFVNLFSSKGAFSRQLTLFSICGMIGLLQGYIALGETDVIWKWTLAVVSILYTLFLTGYEILFMKEQEIPDVDLRSIKLIKNKIPFIVFLVCIPLSIVSLFAPHYQPIAFCIEAVLAVPLTMLQAGFSYNFDDKDWKILFGNFKISDYILLFIKRIWIIILAYATTYTAIFCVFFVIGFIMAFMYKGDLTSMGLIITSKGYAIKAIATYMTGVLMVYTLTIATLIWDYELIKTYEREGK